MSDRTATCPNCGAEIVFRWSGAVQTTCPACRSILVRHDVKLDAVGKVADVPESMSGIQLGTEGRFKGKAFTVIGRIIYRYEAGHWNEWHIRFADDTSGWLSDAQAEFAVTRQSKEQVIAEVTVGEDVRIHDQWFTAVTITRASYGGVEGELPFEYWDKEEVRFIDLKGPGDSFATIDPSETPPLLFVGEFEDFSELRFRNLREVAPTSVPEPRGFNCSSCGAAITLRTGALAQSVACGSCGAILDARDPNLKVLQRHRENVAGLEPEIPLGTTGKLRGGMWTAIGYQVRGIVVEGESYRWREYLLWNPENGFRYLTEYDGHWNDVSVIKGLPKTVKTGEQPEVEYLGTHFKHFQHAIAETHFVIGEFPWQVRVGDKATGDDYVAPPLMLSREATPDEVTWSMGTYTSPSVIQEAFKLKEPLPQPRGVFANQPNPSAGRGGMVKMFFLFACLLMGMCAVRQTTARNETAFSGGYRFNPRTSDTAAFVTEVFELKGHTSNVRVEIETDLSNDNAFFNIALLPESPGKGFEFGRDVGYYFGVEDGESWREGGPTDRAIIGSVPPGRYYLRIEPEHTGLKPVVYTVTAKRNVPRIWPFALALIPLALPMLFTWGIKASFENKRWAESDHAPAAAVEEDDE